MAAYLDLAKPKLSALVVLTSMSAYAIAPYPSTSLASLLCLTVGTTLCCASANAYNQFTEPTYDAQMARTRNRPLVRGAMLPHQAFVAATASGIVGVGMLAAGVNPTVASLGLANIVLYAGIYTPLKRISIVNTWVGALVGALPPMMGWAACSGGDLTSHPGGLLLGLILFAWQFPHFNSLSWSLRADYARAGYCMTVVTDPALNARVSLRWTLAFWPISLLLPYYGLVDWTFLIGSSVLNGLLTARAYSFWRRSSSSTARRLFFMSLIHLPMFLLLAMAHHVALYWIYDDIDPMDKMLQDTETETVAADATTFAEQS